MLFAIVDRHPLSGAVQPPTNFTRPPPPSPAAGSLAREALESQEGRDVKFFQRYVKLVYTLCTGRAWRLPRFRNNDVLVPSKERRYARPIADGRYAPLEVDAPFMQRLK